MSESVIPDWLDDQQPLDPQQSAIQIATLLDLLGPLPLKVLDLGCGSGRILRELLRAGHTMTGIDRDGQLLKACREKLEDEERVKLIEGDFLSMNLAAFGPFDVVCCLGNTFALVHDVGDAVALMRKIVSALGEGGLFVLDDLPGDLWPELTEGNWQAGVSEDGDSQLIWDPADAVFAIRQGAAVDTENWEFKESDTRLRMWTLGSLTLAGVAAGLSAPQRQAGASLLVMSSGMA